MENTAETVERDNETLQTHTLKISFDHAKDADYIQKLVNNPKIFKDFKIWIYKKLQTHVHRL